MKQQGRFAGAVGTNQRNGFPMDDAKGYAV
jgi:hypothetical protein